jgi:hypothetical protein
LSKPAKASKRSKPKASKASAPKSSTAKPSKSTSTSATPGVDPAKLRAWYAHRQGLDGSLDGASPAAVLERAGWARSVGGASPYLTLFSRAGISREAADAAVANLEIHELPAARGCTYVVPADDFAIALRVGRAFAGGEMKAAMKLGVTEEEIDALSEAVVAAVETTALSPDAIRDAVGDKARSLGDEGKKRGLTTTLPIALGLLQSKGAIRRVPENGRLDQQRYKYIAWNPSPLDDDDYDDAAAMRALARYFFTWVGPARLSELQWFTGLGVKATKDLVVTLNLEPVAPGSDLLMLPGDLDAFHAFTPPRDPHYTLVASIDSITATRRELASLLDPSDRGQRVLGEAGKQAIGNFTDLPSHAILDRGRVVGLWEFDVEASEIVYATFGKWDSKLIEAAVEKTEDFVRDQLSDARSFSLDSPKSRSPRIEALRELGRRN